MADLSERVAAARDNIDEVVSKVPVAARLSDLTDLELAGVAAMIHSFYNGVESILKQILRERDVSLPTGESWHRDLIQKATSVGVLSEETAVSVREYLAFRHFFSHAYAFDLEPERLEPLTRNLSGVHAAVKRDLASLSDLNAQD